MAVPIYFPTNKYMHSFLWIQDSSAFYGDYPKSLSQFISGMTILMCEVCTTEWMALKCLEMGSDKMIWKIKNREFRRHLRRFVRQLTVMLEMQVSFYTEEMLNGL